MILHLQSLGQPVHIDRLSDIDDWRDAETTDADDADADDDSNTDDSDQDIHDTESAEPLKISDVWDEVDDENDPDGNDEDYLGTF
jgi:hypothetical protein